eukprot:COSAG02_NODE_2257_length_9341_cov_13.355118_13_plen_172_part_01
MEKWPYRKQCFTTAKCRPSLEPRETLYGMLSYTCENCLRLRQCQYVSLSHCKLPAASSPRSHQTKSVHAILPLPSPLSREHRRSPLALPRNVRTTCILREACNVVSTPTTGESDFVSPSARKSNVRSSPCIPVSISDLHAATRARAALSEGPAASAACRPARRRRRRARGRP